MSWGPVAAGVIVAVGIVVGCWINAAYQPGRYQIASGAMGAAWVLDTRTGTARYVSVNGQGATVEGR